LLSIEKKPDVWAVTGPMTIDHIQSMLKTEHVFVADSALTIDLSGITDVDTAAISLMMEWLRRAQQSKTQLTFTHLPENLTQLAHLYQVTDILHTPN
jgi:phospholipid transport system transporter-binding protein